MVAYLWQKKNNWELASTAHTSDQHTNISFVVPSDWSDGFITILHIYLMPVNIFDLMVPTTPIKNY